MKNFILIENNNQLKIFLKKYRFKYLPIVYDIYCQAILEKEGLDFLTINRELKYDEILQTYSNAWKIGDLMVNTLDKLNEDNFYQLFGVRGMKIFSITAKYYLKYGLLANTFHAMIGLSRILHKNRPCILYYFTFDYEKDFCTDSRTTGYYFCPKRILPILLSIFEGEKDISYIELKDRIMPPLTDKIHVHIINLTRRLKKKLLRCIFDRELKDSAVDKTNQKNILVVSNGYHLMPAIDQLLMYNKVLKKLMHSGEFYILSKSDNRVSAIPVGDLTIPSRVNSKRYVTKINLSFTFSEFDINEIIPQDSSDYILIQKLLKKVTAILDKFIKENIYEMVTIWNKMQELDNAYNLMSLVWDSPPIANLKRGIISEYFRIQKKPRVGIQHGGSYGVKYYGSAHFDSDYDNCEYYFGYGYSNRELRKAFPQKNIITKVLSKDAPDNKIPLAPASLIKRKEVKVLYVFPFNYEAPFFQLARPNRIDEFLFGLQKKIIRELSQYNNEKIIIKFPPANFRNHALKVFIDNLKHTFIIETNPFPDVLKKYFAEYILIDIVSTPVEESLLLSPYSKLLIYNHPSALLTKDAFDLLSKRAVVTSDENEFIKYTASIFNNTFPERDASNNEYIYRYGKIPYFDNVGDIKRLFNLIDDKVGTPLKNPIQSIIDPNILGVINAKR